MMRSSRPLRLRSVVAAPSRPLVEYLEHRVLLAADLASVQGGILRAVGADTAADADAGRKGKVSPQLLAVAAESRRRLLDDPSAAVASFKSADPALVVGSGAVAVKVVADAAAASVAAVLDSLGGLGFVEALRRENVAVGAVPLAAIDRLGSVPGLASVTPAYGPQTFVGLTTTQGDDALRADLARAQLGLDGTGIKVGVISDSYNRRTNAATTAPTDIANNDLPPADRIQILDDTFAGSDEGRAMMQLIHDIAPGASLAFHTAVATTAAGAVVTDASIAQAIQDLAAAGCDIIVDDIGGPDEPMFMDGLAARAIDQAAGQGVVYFSSAANGGRTGYDSAYRDSGTTITIDGNPVGRAHDFDPGAGVDFRQAVTIPNGRGAFIEFQWDRPHTSLTGVNSSTDMDIFLIDTAVNQLVASSEGANSAGGDPVEALFFANTTGRTNFEIVITRFSAAGTEPGRIKFVNRQSTMTINQFDTASPTLFGHQNARLGASVGAAFWNNTPEFGTNPPVVESFSSVGGTPILFDNAGTRLAAAENRNMPRFTATDGGNNTFFGTDVAQDADTRPNFFGTSAAAPEAAAVAALMLQRVPAASPAQVFAALAATAVDMDDPFLAGFQTGRDDATGAGLIRALEAVQNLAGQTPNRPPAVGAFTDSPDSVAGGNSVTLTAGSVTDPDGNNTVDNVTFYRESNGIAGLQAVAAGGDTVLGTDTSSPYSVAAPTTGLAAGAYTYYARATDNLGAVSPVVQLTNTVTGTGQIRGTVWRDNNGDGQRGTAAVEPGLAGVAVFLDQDNDDVKDTGEVAVTTDASGNYAFTGLTPLTYNVRQVVPAGFEQTFPAPSAGSFGINVVFPDNTLTAAQKAIFTTAANRWAQIITGDVPDVTFNGRTIDDLEIEATGPAIDGSGGILGQAGPTNFRSGTLLPFRGIMQFDSADLAALEQSGQLVDVILHEMGHVLGIGTIWDDKNLLSGAGTSNPRFTGAGATAEYRAIFSGTSDTSVPVENTGGPGTRDSHFRDSAFNNELMTGFLNTPGPNPLSRVTAGSLADLGYAVNVAAADAYTRPAAVAPSGDGGATPATGGRIVTIDVDPDSPGATVPASDVRPAAAAAAAAAALTAGHSVTLAAGQSVTGIDFGNRPLTVDTVGPRVAAVFADSTAWTAAFRNALQAQGLGTAALGYRVPAGVDQLKSLPWSNVDRVRVVFSEPVAVQQADLAIRGVNTATYAFKPDTAANDATDGFVYDPATFTATWTLAGNVLRDKLMLDLDGDAPNGVADAAGNRLDGEWASGSAGQSFPSGNGTAGGDLRFRLDVLPGNVDGTGAVNLADFGRLRAAFGRPLTATSILADLTGDGAVNLADFGVLRQRFGQALPAAEPT